MKQITLLIALLITSNLIATIPSLEQLSLDEKIGQLFIVATVSNPARNGSFMDQQPYNLDPNHALKMVQEYHIGGIIFLGEGVPSELVTMANQLQQQSKTPLLVVLDAEWGLSMRLRKDVITYPRAMTLGALAPEDDHLTYQLGKEIGDQCKAIGVHYNTAPVADVNSEPKNPIINTRSFGENPEFVAHKAALFMSGLQDAGIIACAKHWPGHGATTSDSHHELPILLQTKKQLEATEFVPFKHLVSKGVRSVLTAHLAVPELTEHADMPATLSHNLTTNILRKELGFTGLIVTDGLGMTGVTSKLSAGEPELKALQAGHDILLCPVDVPRAIDRIKQAIEQKTLSENEIDQHVTRILQAKRDAHISRTVQYNKNKLQSEHAKQLKEKLYRAAITLARNTNQRLPITSTHEITPVVTIGDDANSPFAQKLQQYIPITLYQLDLHASQKECEQLADQLKQYSHVITTVHIPSRSGMIEMHHTEQQHNTLPPYISLINNLGQKATLVIFGNPYNLANIPDAGATIIAYENEPEAQIAAADTIVGRHNPHGKLPVSAGIGYKQGIGFSLCGPQFD